MKKTKPQKYLNGACDGAGAYMLNVTITIHEGSDNKPFSVQIPRLSSGMVKVWAAYSNIPVKGFCMPCGEFNSEWDSPHEWYFSIMATKHDGPLEAYKLTFERFTEYGKVQVVASKLNLINCKPFLAIGSGLFACSDIASSNTPCAHLHGVPWSATVTEAKT